MTLVQRKFCFRFISVNPRGTSGDYGQATALGQLEALESADRRHLFENASAAFLGAVRRSVSDSRQVLGAGPIDPWLLTAAVRSQYNGWRRLVEVDAESKKLSDCRPFMVHPKQTTLLLEIIRPTPSDLG